MTENELVNRAVKVIGDEFARTPPEQRQEMLSQLATTALCLLHGTYGREWVLGYLRGAVEDLGDPNATRISIEAMTRQ